MRADLKYSGVGPCANARGLTLTECVLAIAMIAVSLPMVMLVLGHSRSSVSSTVMDGEAQRAILMHATDLMDGGLPAEIERMVWAHASSGECIGQIGESDYEEGLSRHQGQMVRYLVVAEVGELEHSAAPFECLHLHLEHPPSASRAQRSRISFHTGIRP